MARIVGVEQPDQIVQVGALLATNHDFLEKYRGSSTAARAGVPLDARIYILLSRAALINA